MKTKEELIKNSDFTYVEEFSVESCSACKGIGRIYREELTDYHKREYGTFIDICKTCNGDGRVVIQKRFIKANLREDKRVIPFTNFDGNPFEVRGEYTNLKLHIDKRDRWMEEKYPNLAKLNYDNYDRVLEECKVHARLKK